MVAAMLRKEPGERPSVPQMLELPVVQKHLRLYARLIRDTVAKRRESFKRSLASFCTADEASPVFDAALVLSDQGGRCSSPTCCVLAAAHLAYSHAVNVG